MSFFLTPTSTNPSSSFLLPFHSLYNQNIHSYSSFLFSPHIITPLKPHHLIFHAVSLLPNRFPSDNVNLLFSNKHIHKNHIVLIIILSATVACKDLVPSLPNYYFIMIEYRFLHLVLQLPFFMNINGQYHLPTTTASEFSLESEKLLADQLWKRGSQRRVEAWSFV